MKYAVSYFQPGQGVQLEIIEADCKFSAIKKMLDYEGKAKTMDELSEELYDTAEVEFKVIPVFVSVRCTSDTGGQHHKFVPSIPTPL
ncbi:MAG TPA: hypothetical protein V6C58_18760 [Allocoleopsis sp.]